MAYSSHLNSKKPKPRNHTFPDLLMFLPADRSVQSAGSFFRPLPEITAIWRRFFHVFHETFCVFPVKSLTQKSSVSDPFCFAFVFLLWNIIIFVLTAKTNVPNLRLNCAQNLIGRFRQPAHTFRLFSFNLSIKIFNFFFSLSYMPIDFLSFLQ